MAEVMNRRMISPSGEWVLTSLLAAVQQLWRLEVFLPESSNWRMIFIFMFAAATSFAATESIRYESMSTTYDLVRSSDQIQLRERDRVKSIPITFCNRELVKKFWNGTVAQVQSLPRVPGAKYRPVLSMNGKFYSPQPFSPKAVRQLDAKFLVLVEREKKQCGKKR